MCPVQCYSANQWLCVVAICNYGGCVGLIAFRRDTFPTFLVRGAHTKVHPGEASNLWATTPQWYWGGLRHPGPPLPELLTPRCSAFSPLYCSPLTWVDLPSHPCPSDPPSSLLPTRHHVLPLFLAPHIPCFPSGSQEFPLTQPLDPLCPSCSIPPFLPRKTVRGSALGPCRHLLRGSPSASAARLH